MSDVRKRLRELSLPCPLGDRVKSAIDRAAKEADLSYVRAREIWYGNARRIEHHEAEKIERAWERKQTQQRNRELLNEWHQHRAQMARIEALLAQDEEFYSEMLAPYRQAMGRIG